MVNTQIIANKLNENLNTIAETLNIGHSFQLMAHAGKAKKANVIEGILKPVNNDAMGRGGTLSGAVKNRVVYVAELIVPTGLDNKSVLQVENVINKLVMDYDGLSFTNGNDTIVMEIASGTPKDYAMRGGVGSSVPMAFTVNVNYGAYALLNGVKSWTLDGVAIPYTKEVVILNKDGVTLSVMEAKDQQTISTAQRKQYKFTIPYDKTNTVCTTLKNDILNGDFRKTYQLAYADGVVTYSAKVSLFNTGDIGSQNTGDATTINVSFVDAGAQNYYDEAGNQYSYSIGLLNFPFDEQSENTFYFDTQALQQTWFNSKVTNESVNYKPITAPNLNNVLLTNIVYDVYQGQNFLTDINKFTNLNYAVIRKVINPLVGAVSTEYYYYWIQKCTQGADGVLLLDLKLDTLQTYMFNQQLIIPECLIERAHLNRWVEMPDPLADNRVRFNGFADSPLFEREPLQNFSKKVVSRQLIGLNNTNYGAVDNNVTIRDFFNKYVQGWLYVYVKLDLFKKEPFQSIRNQYRLPAMFSEKYKNGNIYHPFLVFAFPIVESDKIKINFLGIGEGGSVTANWDAESFLKYLETMGLVTDDIPDLNTYIVTMRISQTPPINDWTQCPNISFEFVGESVDDPNAYVKIIENLAANEDNDIARFLPLAGTSIYFVFLYLMTHDMSAEPDSALGDNNTIRVTLPQLQYIFERTDIIGANKNVAFNPKLLGQDFTEINVGQFTSPPFTYDAQKLNSNLVDLRWRESLVPGITRAYIGLTTNNSTLQANDFYSNDAYQGLIGATISQDTTIPGTSNALADYLSQNKNFYQQQAIGTVASGVGGVLGTAALGAATGSAVPGVGTLIGAGVGLAAGVIQTTLNIDNLKNTPSNAKNIDGNAVLPFGINGGKTYIEIKRALPKELNIANDFMFMNGFTYNQVGNVVDYIHTRKYFNYIKAQITDIQGIPLSNEIRNDIKQRFANGLRFWNMDTFASYGVQYEKENYELWLEDE